MAEKRCGCKGVRSCLLCEEDSGNGSLEHSLEVVELKWHQCQSCGTIFQRGSTAGDFTCSRTTESCCRATVENAPDFSGVAVIPDFIDESEERSLLQQIDSQGWVESQSGRRKQDYGPKVNFKRQKVQLGLFNGLPSYIQPLLARLNSKVPCLKDFVPVELCCLDYKPERGAAIDPHTDDSWVWGERLVTINLLSSTILTFSNCCSSGSISNSSASLETPTLVEVLLPQRSLVVVMGWARHKWQHSIKREHISSRRIAITLRELAGEFLPGGRHEAAGRTILDMAAKFAGSPINLNRT